MLETGNYYNRNYLVEGYVVGEIEAVTGSKTNHLGLSRQILGYTVLAGKTDPRLHANEGSVGQIGVPQSEISYLRACESYGMAVFVRSESNGSGNVLEEDCIIVEKAVLEINVFAIAQRIFFVLSCYEAGVREYHASYCVGVAEINVIILEGQIVRERYAESGMCTGGEGQNLIAGVDDAVVAMENIVVQGVAYNQLKIKGIFLLGFFCSNQLEGKCICIGIDFDEFSAAGKAVAFHFVFVALVCIFSTEKSSAYGEDDASATVPVGCSSLPDVLCSVCVLYRKQLSAQRIDFNGELFIVYLMYHDFLLQVNKFN